MPVVLGISIVLNFLDRSYNRASEPLVWSSWRMRLLVDQYVITSPRRKGIISEPTVTSFFVCVLSMTDPPPAFTCVVSELVQKRRAQVPPVNTSRRTRVGSSNIAA